MDVILPELGEGIEKAKVLQIFVKEGDVVENNQDLIEIESDKAIVTIPSTIEGTIEKILIKENTEVPTGSTILTIIESGTKPQQTQENKEPQPNQNQTSDNNNPNDLQTTNTNISSNKTANQEIVNNYSQANYNQSSGLEPPASPSLRKTCRELNIDLNRITGSGNGGRILLVDVKNYINWLQSIAFSNESKNSINTEKNQPNEKQLLPDFSKWGDVETKEVTTLRGLISKSMTESWTTIPHVTQYENANLTKIFDLKNQYKETFKKSGSRLTITSFIIQATINTLKKHQIFNASIDLENNKIFIKKYINLSIAVSTDSGLIVPNIKNVDKKDLKQISTELVNIATKARERKIKPEELQGGTFTISNQGGIGGTHFTPIIFQPQVAILGLGQSFMGQNFDGKKFIDGLQLPLCLSYDHRLIDGAQAATFISDLKNEIENFDPKYLK